MGITGDDIRSIRGSFGWSIDQFARVLGVHPVTLNRWELAGPKQPQIEGMAYSILVGLKQRVLKTVAGRRIPKAQVKQTGTEIEQLLVVGGVLVALAALLTFVNGDKR
ncbi:MAG: helix-turn-helix domain-containing protein [Planctomycetes bacterium]|nr:helix-turn-helix domain-containing protein [Planctomycetota bacterium]